MRDLAFFCAARQAREATASAQRLAADLARRIAALTLPPAAETTAGETAPLKPRSN